MTTQVKWIVASMTMLMVVFFALFFTTKQNIATNTTSEVEVLADSLSVGIIRAQIDDADNFAYFDKDEIIANLVVNVAREQMVHKYDIEVDYAFLDKAGKVTTDEAKMRGLVFSVVMRDSNGVMRGSAQKRLALNYPD